MNVHFFLHIIYRIELKEVTKICVCTTPNRCGEKKIKLKRYKRRKGERQEPLENATSDDELQIK